MWYGTSKIDCRHEDMADFKNDPPITNIFCIKIL
jgi:hypothetical protein